MFGTFGSRLIRSLTLVMLSSFNVACTLSIDSAVPTPQQDLSAPGSGEVLTFDLRETAGVPVEVEGRSVNLLLLARAESVMIINRDIARELDLNSVLFGMGSATVRDGDHRVSGEVRQARYRIAPGGPERVWALDLETDIHPDYDGAISFGAIPASRFRLLINDPPADGARQVEVPLVLQGRSPYLEAERDYAALEFSHELALHQEPVTANRKAVFYMSQAGRLSSVSEVEPFLRLFGNSRPHVRFEARPPLAFGELPIAALIGEVTSQYNAPDPELDPGRDVIVIRHDRRRTVDAPTLYLGRAFFNACSELRVNRASMVTERAAITALCRADALTP